MRKTSVETKWLGNEMGPRAFYDLAATDGLRQTLRRGCNVLLVKLAKLVYLLVYEYIEQKLNELLYNCLSFYEKKSIMQHGCVTGKLKEVVSYFY